MMVVMVTSTDGLFSAGGFHEQMNAAEERASNVARAQEGKVRFWCGVKTPCNPCLNFPTEEA